MHDLIPYRFIHLQRSIDLQRTSIKKAVVFVLRNRFIYLLSYLLRIPQYHGGGVIPACTHLSRATH